MNAVASNLDRVVLEQCFTRRCPSLGELIGFRGVVDDERNAIQCTTCNLPVGSPRAAENCLDPFRELGDLILEHENIRLGVESVARSHDNGHRLGVRGKFSVKILVETRKLSGTISRAQSIKNVSLEVSLIDDAANLERRVLPKMGHPYTLA